MNYEEEHLKTLSMLRDLELALNESSIITITDSTGVIQFVNDNFCNVSQYQREELIGEKQNVTNSGYHSKEFFKGLWQTISSGHIWKGEIKNRAKDGSYFWFDTTIVPFLTESNEPYKYIGIRHDITERKLYEEKIKKMAFYDSLTMLPNRNFLGEWIKDESFLTEEKLTVLCLNIDRFKLINDTFGHRIGDVVLKESAKRLQNCIMPPNVVIRQSGDAFIIVLKNVYSHDDIVNIINDIKSQFLLPFIIDEHDITTTVSIGISRCECDYQTINIDSIEQQISEAEIALFHAKKNGGNTHCFNTDDQNNDMQRYYQLEQELKYALGRGQFSIVYHPLIQLKENYISGVEALLRWHNPRLGSVPPSEFIPLLEEFGYIIPVGKWILKEVCQQMKEWHEQGLCLKRVSVNVSPVQFRDYQFINDIKDVLQETGLEAKYLELEITEGMIFNIKAPEKLLEELREVGVSISIDDFGTGYSSLHYLKRLPINTIKIDKSFIDDLDEQDEVLVNTIIGLGKNLNFNVVAEGIETETQLAYLKDQNCHEGQGFYWSQPVGPKQMKDMLAKQIDSCLV